MRSSRRSKLAALAVFLSIAAVVIGGMTWATVASFELAKKTVSEEHHTKVHRALWQMESHMKGILFTEAARPYTDYVDYHTDRPVAVLGENGLELDAEKVILRSPIAMRQEPPHDWIDLYFQVDQDGVPSSPQFTDESPWAFEKGPSFTPSERRARQTWPWFTRILPTVDLRNRVGEALKRDSARYRTESAPEPRRTVRSAQADPTVGGGRPKRPDLPGRKRSLSQSQAGYVPREQCVDPLVAARNIRGLPAAIASILDDVSPPPGDVSVAPGPFAPPFWLGADERGAHKLAFVRECSADAAVFHQGFLGDWDRLKPELLRQIEDSFPDADLEPVFDERETEAETDDFQLRMVPATLVVPGVPGDASAEAWRSIRPMLLTTWATAAAVLVIAGWGMANLVALTERRLQFAYAVTHELRTPLTTFRLYSDMLSAGLVPEESKQEYLDTLNRESLRLSSLVEGVLEYARLENHKVKLHLSDTDGASLLGLVADTLRKRCQDTGIEPRTQNDLPPDRSLRTDIELVSQITGVLVNNACRHARGSKNPLVLVQLGGENGRLHLDVVDSGPGIDLADSHRIFKPFRRGRNADASAQGGIGLGLALARNWADLLGGRLDLVARHHPQYGGAHFRLTIPAQPPSSM